MRRTSGTRRWPRRAARCARSAAVEVRLTVTGGSHLDQRPVVCRPTSRSSRDRPRLPAGRRRLRDAAGPTAAVRSSSTSTSRRLRDSAAATAIPLSGPTPQFAAAIAALLAAAGLAARRTRPAMPPCGSPSAAAGRRPRNAPAVGRAEPTIVDPGLARTRRPGRASSSDGLRVVVAASGATRRRRWPA